MKTDIEVSSGQPHLAPHSCTTPSESVAPTLAVCTPAPGARESDAPENPDGAGNPVGHGLIANSVEAQGLTATVAADGSAAATPNDGGLDATISMLAALPKTNFDRVRKLWAKKLELQLGTLDGLVKDARIDLAVTDRMPFSEVSASSVPREPADLYDEMLDVIHRYVILEPEQGVAVVLWIVLTWVADSVDVYVLLIINAPERACAKTLLQTLAGRLSYRALFAANASLSALFRAIQKWNPTVFIDEADTFLREHPEVIGLINAGYKAGGFVLRSESMGDSFEPRIFPVGGPKSIAGIGMEKHLSDATRSRSLDIKMRRKMKHESVERLRTAPPGLFERISSDLARFAQDYSEQIRLARPDLPEQLNDREQDSWEPLLAIAELAGTEWLQRATAAALKISGSVESSVSTGNELLADIKAIFEKKDDFKISTVDLIDALVAEEEGPWATYNRGRPISPRQLSRQLATYGIHSKTIRQKFGTPKGYDASQFEDAFARYLPPSISLTSQIHKSPEPVATPPKEVPDISTNGLPVRSDDEF